MIHIFGPRARGAAAVPLGEQVDITITLPTYNERENAVKLIPELLGALEGRRVEVLVVDDASPDRTADAVEGLGLDCVKVLRRSEPRELSAAVRAGFDAARGGLILLMDADGAHTAEHAAALLDAMGSAAMMIGSRYLAGGSGMADKGLAARLGSRLVAAGVRRRLGLDLTDPGHSLRAFRREVWDRVGDRVQARGNAFFSEFSARAAWAGFEVREIPIQYGSRGHGVTKLNMWDQGLGVLGTLWRLRRP